MKDAFATFGFERRPSIDLPELQERYLNQAALLHPDRGGNAHAFSELGAARVLLENSAERLHHLIQLMGGKDVTCTTVDEAEEIMDVTSLLLQIKQYLSKLESALTPLAQATLVQPGRKYLHQLEQAQLRIGNIMQALNEKVQAADRAWPNTSLFELTHIAHSLRLVQKKEVQVSESLFQLQNALRAFSHITSNN